ncbi:hypothetical protein OGAPHI_004538 [Ogataea philodendri]|uniref:Uncharacterized protein n=1 Tax=Ogataea philodendri TaxID=1378263 RepID=A0A9P8T5J5_9ASCO|nr:uncharacterized protein OGAPHI_004538 [Ogataea philodendri]KAH3666349.1 hypothetical protein OGAPHI_004538 [Ogataea philodendri]
MAHGEDLFSRGPEPERALHVPERLHREVVGDQRGADAVGGFGLGEDPVEVEERSEDQGERGVGVVGVDAGQQAQGLVRLVAVDGLEVGVPAVVELGDGDGGVSERGVEDACGEDGLAHGGEQVDFGAVVLRAAKQEGDEVDEEVEFALDGEADGREQVPRVAGGGVERLGDALQLCEQLGQLLVCRHQAVSVHGEEVSEDKYGDCASGNLGAIARARDSELVRGRTAVVTGGGNGIGREVVRLLVSKGANVCFVDLSEEESGSLVRELASARVLYQKADVTSWAGLRGAFESAWRRFGSIDMVVPAAGIMETKDFLAEEVVDGELQAPSYAALDINQKGVLNAVKLALFYFKKRGERESRASRVKSIVLVASTSGYFGGLGQLTYKVAKHGVVGILRGLQAHQAEGGFVVNCVAPSYTETYMMGPLRDIWRQGGGPVNTAAEVAAAVVQLLVSETGGQTWLVSDGEVREIERALAGLAPQWCGEAALAKLRRGGQILAEVGRYPLPAARQEYE